MFKSTDGGENWSEMNKGLQYHIYSRYVQSIAIDHKNTKVIYIGTYGDGFF